MKTISVPTRFASSEQVEEQDEVYKFEFIIPEFYMKQNDRQT